MAGSTRRFGGGNVAAREIRGVPNPDGSSGLAMLRLREKYTEAKMEKELRKSSKLAWMFKDQTGQNARPSISRWAIRTRCRRTILGFLWALVTTRSRFPMFNHGQLVRIRAIVTTRAVERRVLSKL